MNENNAFDWSKDDVIEWAKRENLNEIIINCIYREEIDGKTILTLYENDIKDLREKYKYRLKISDIKHFWIAVRTLQKDNLSTIICMGLGGDCLHQHQQQQSTTTSSVLITQQQQQQQHNYPLGIGPPPYHHHHHHLHGVVGSNDLIHLNDIERISPPLSVDGRATSIPPEVFKTVISLGYSFLVTWITAFVMVVVHERVPDMKRYPPLPDIFLDNVPHIPWAFHMCEITGTLLFAIWSCVCILHKYRLVLLRRFFALAGTVFLLRCVTMLITSLSVPGTHLQCNPNDYKVDDTNLTLGEALQLRISRAYTIWSGLGMSIQGVRTCGDYMFSGHTVALTLLNFFITEYTQRNLYFLHTMTWLLNMFGIFFILAAHEHYSIDVFVAFYITSRLFLYYHTLANNQALMSHDSNRTRIWFPMFSYFESSVDGIIPNEYDSITDILSNIFSCIICVKDSFMLTARRIWIVPPNLPPLPKAFISSRQSTPKKSIKSSSNSIGAATTQTSATTSAAATVTATICGTQNTTEISNNKDTNSNSSDSNSSSSISSNILSNGNSFSNQQHQTHDNQQNQTTKNNNDMIAVDSLIKKFNNSNVINNRSSPLKTQKTTNITIATNSNTTSTGCNALTNKGNFLMLSNDIRNENMKKKETGLNLLSSSSSSSSSSSTAASALYAVNLKKDN